MQAPEWVRRAQPAGPLPSPRPCNDMFAEVAFCNQHSSLKLLPCTHFADNKCTSSRGQVTAQGPKATQQQHRGSCHLFDPAWAPAQTQGRSSQGPSQRTVAGSGLSLCALPCHFRVTSKSLGWFRSTGLELSVGLPYCPRAHKGAAEGLTILSWHQRLRADIL